MRELTKESVIEIVNSVLGEAKVGIEEIDCELSDYGMDSMMFIRTVVLLEEELDCVFPDEILVFSKLNTARKMYNALKISRETEFESGEK